VLQLVPQFLVVVDLAVEDHPDGPVLVCHGLLAAIEVDDAEPPHAQSDAVANIDALLIGSSMSHRPAHGPDVVFLHLGSVPSDNSSDTAHKGCLVLG
jgi:hypothetical protein